MIQLALKEKRCLEIYPSNSAANAPIFEAVSMVDCKKQIITDDEESLIKVVISPNPVPKAVGMSITHHLEHSS